MQLKQLTFFLGMIFTANIIFIKPLKGQVNGNHDITYVSPMQGSYLNSTATDILIRYSKLIQQNTLGFALKYGANTISINYELLDDGKTVLIHPLNPLPTNVSIEVFTNSGILFDPSI